MVQLNSIFNENVDCPAGDSSSSTICTQKDIAAGSNWSEKDLHRQRGALKKPVVCVCIFKLGLTERSSDWNDVRCAGRHQVSELVCRTDRSTWSHEPSQPKNNLCKPTHIRLFHIYETCHFSTAITE